MLSSPASWRLLRCSCPYKTPRRALTTLEHHPHIYVFPSPAASPPSHLLTLLPTTPPTPSLSIGTTTHLPPTPTSLHPNSRFLALLHAVLRAHAHADPALISAAQALAAPAAATSQERAGAGGVGGWIHVSDARAPVAFGRIAWPEDIFGSVQVDRAGMVRPGTYQASGTYRVVTRDGILGLSPFLRERLVERLEREEAAVVAGL